MDFLRGDKIHKIINGNVDKSIIYEIESVREENDGNWHDGYITTWTASLLGEKQKFLLGLKIWGSMPEFYAEKVE
jgi:hypothetical protein|uniref:Uncharacterized protein n=1 Tax=viral metagenome TaxID=1070528 RepID=A0A6C0HQC6_9ZZZZ